MSGLLSMLRRGPTEEPVRLLLTGQEGVGKTTFAAGCPGALFLTAEDGGGDLDYARIVLDNWPDLRRAVRDLAHDEHDFRALVIDTIDTYERLLWAWLVEDAGVKSIEEIGGGYGKGYTAAAEEMAGLRADLDALRSRRRMHVILLAHVHVRPFNDPLAPPYDRYEIRLHKGAASLWSAWADAVLFACFDVTVLKVGGKGRPREANATEKGKVVGEAKRVIYTTKEPAYDAKNRYKLPEELPLDWSAFARAMRWTERDAALRPGTKSATAALTEEHDPSWREDQPRFFADLAALDLGVNYDTIKAWCAALDRPKPSAMPREGRQKLLAYLATDKGRSSLRQFAELGTAAAK